MSFIEKMKEQAKKSIKTIVLPEGNDIRTLKAAQQVIKEEFANIIIVGDPYEINDLAKANNIDLFGTTIINPQTSDKLSKYSNDLFELRKHKGMTLDDAKELLKTNTRYYATMMVKEGDADGFISGAAHTTADTLRPALQILRTEPGIKLVSTFFVMILPDKQYGDNGTFIFSDCGLNEYPNAEELAQIAKCSAKSFRDLIGDEPKIALLSYSTHGSADSPLTDKVVEAARLVREDYPDILCDGEIQVDAAVVPEVSKRKAPNSPIKGNANILIFPDLDSGNIGYKLTQRFGHAEAYGPICQGLGVGPVNDLSRGCTVDDIVVVTAITAVQAQHYNK